MDKLRPILKTFILALSALIVVSALLLLPISTCSTPAHAAGTESYLLLDYIESDGTQYIDTGYVPTSTTKWVMDFQLASYTLNVNQYNGVLITGAALTIGINSNQFAMYTSGTVNKYFGSYNTSRHTAAIDLLNLVASLDSTSTAISLGALPSGLSLYIGAVNNNGNASNKSSFKYYSSQIYTNGVLARDFVPVERTSDGAIGLLDRVNDVFYANQGTGTFTAGYLANDYYVCDYTQSTGSQYIDSGVTPSLNDAIVFSGKLDSTSNSYTGLMGANYNGRFYVMSNTSNFTFGVTDSQVYTSQSVDTNKHTFMVDNLLQIYSIDNSSTSYTAGNSYPKSSYMIHAVNNPSIAKSYSKIYLAQIFTNHTLVRNMIPVYDPSTNQAGMWDNINGVWYGNAGTGSFGYSITGGATVYAVSTENALNSALSGASLGDLVVLTGDIDVSTQTISTNNATVYWGSHSLGSSYHANSSLYTVENWYSTPFTVSASGKLVPSTTYTARFQISVGSAALFSSALTNAITGDIINFTAAFTYTSASFTVPADVTINQNGYTILPPANPPLAQVGYNSDPDATTAEASFTAGNTYYAIYVTPTYTVRLIVDPDVVVNMSGLNNATRTEYASYSDISFDYTYGNAVSLPVPTLSYYSFHGWYLNGVTGPYSGISATDSGNKVFYATWVEAPTISIGNVNIYRNLQNDGDRLVIFTYDIVWQNVPDANVRTLFMFRLMDETGTNVIATTQPYYFYYGGYYMGVAGFYFPDDTVINWNGEYQIRIDGNPSQWYTISDVRAQYNITGINYTESSDQSSNQTELASWIIGVSQTLENDWTDLATALVTTNSSGNQVLTSTGQSYFLNTVANINLMAPSVFTATAQVIVPEPGNPVPEITATPTLVDRWENQYEGTWVETAFQGIGDLFGVSWRMVTSILCLVLWVVFAAFSQMRWGTTDAGLWMGAVMFGVAVTMGIMNWAIVATAAILMALYSLYIMFWRQG